MDRERLPRKESSGWFLALEGNGKDETLKEICCVLGRGNRCRAKFSSRFPFLYRKIPADYPSVLLFVQPLRHDHDDPLSPPGARLQMAHMQGGVHCTEPRYERFSLVPFASTDFGPFGHGLNSEVLLNGHRDGIGGQSPACAQRPNILWHSRLHTRVTPSLDSWFAARHPEPEKYRYTCT